MKFTKVLSLFFGLILLCCSASAGAGCNFKQSNGSFGTVDSFTLATTPQTIKSGSGFFCTSINVLGLLVTNYVSATILSTNHSVGSDPALYNAATGDHIPFIVCDSANCDSPYGVGSTVDWKIFNVLSLLGLFNVADGTWPIYFRTAAGMNVAAGNYSNTLNLHWNYKLCIIGIVACAYTKGEGNSSINVEMQVTNQCFIDSAPDIHFNSAALPANFTSIASSLRIRCTKNASYAITMASQNPSSSNWRQMKHSDDGGTHYLQYQLYRPDTTIWNENNALTLIGTGDAQSVNYTAKINSEQTHPPAGNYQDTVLVTVSY